MKASELLVFLKNAELIGSPDAEFTVVDDIKGEKKSALSFIAEESYIGFLATSKATVLIVEDSIINDPKILKWLNGDKRACISVKKAYLNFIKVLHRFMPIQKSTAVNNADSVSQDVIVYPNVFVADNVKVGAGTILYPGVVLMEGVSIGANCILHPNVSIYANSVIGNRVIIGAGSVIGSDGFGFISDDDGSKIKIPHLGYVLIEDDVEIGSNTSIDRATLGYTHIKKGAKIDNLVQVAHNCIVGENNILCGMVGLSGSTELGKNVIMAARSGTKDHIKIGDNSIVTALSNVSKDLQPDSKVKGVYPARPMEEEIKIQVLVGKLPELYERIKKLEQEKNK